MQLRMGAIENLTLNLTLKLKVQIHQRCTERTCIPKLIPAVEKLETIRASISTRMKHVYTMEWCTSVRMNGLELYMCTYMNLTMQNEKKANCEITFQITFIKKGKITNFQGEVCIYVVIIQSLSLLTLFDPVVCNASGSSVHGILQARILERVAVSFSRVSSQPRD